MQIENKEALKCWLIDELQPIYDAEPDSLADYVIALLKKNKNEKELMELCQDKLYDFLTERTEGFVTTLFEVLQSKIYLDENRHSVYTSKDRLLPSNNRQNQHQHQPHQTIHHSSQHQPHLVSYKNLPKRDQEQIRPDDFINKPHKHERNRRDLSNVSRDKNQRRSLKSNFPQSPGSKFRNASRERSRKSIENARLKSSETYRELLSPPLRLPPSAKKRSSRSISRSDDRGRRSYESKLSRASSCSRSTSLSSGEFPLKRNRSRSSTPLENEQPHSYGTTLKEHGQPDYSYTGYSAQQLPPAALLQQPPPPLLHHHHHQLIPPPHPRMVNMSQPPPPPSMVLPMHAYPQRPHFLPPSYDPSMRPPVPPMPPQMYHYMPPGIPFKDSTNDSYHPTAVPVEPYVPEPYDPLNPSMFSMPPPPLPHNINNNNDITIINNNINNNSNMSSLTDNIHCSWATNDKVKNQEDDEDDNGEDDDDDETSGDVINGNSCFGGINRPGSNLVVVNIEQSGPSHQDSTNSTSSLSSSLSSASRKRTARFAQLDTSSSSSSLPSAALMTSLAATGETSLSLAGGVDGDDNDSSLKPPPTQIARISGPEHPSMPSRVQSQNNTTLELRKIPREDNTIANINNHFSKFGIIVNLQINWDNDPGAALVAFASSQQALLAYRSKEPFLNNRFIKIFWHNPDKSGASGKGGAKSYSENSDEVKVKPKEHFKIPDRRFLTWTAPKTKVNTITASTTTTATAAVAATNAATNVVVSSFNNPTISTGTSICNPVASDDNDSLSTSVNDASNIGTSASVDGGSSASNDTSSANNDPNAIKPSQNITAAITATMATTASTTTTTPTSKPLPATTAIAQDLSSKPAIPARKLLKINRKVNPKDADAEKVLEVKKLIATKQSYLDNLLALQNSLVASLEKKKSAEDKAKLKKEFVENESKIKKTQEELKKLSATTVAANNSSSNNIKPQHFSYSQRHTMHKNVHKLVRSTSTSSSAVPMVTNTTTTTIATSTAIATSTSMTATNSVLKESTSTTSINTSASSSNSTASNTIATNASCKLLAQKALLDSELDQMTNRTKDDDNMQASFLSKQKLQNVKTDSLALKPSKNLSLSRLSQPLHPPPPPHHHHHHFKDKFSRKKMMMMTSRKVDRRPRQLLISKLPSGEDEVSIVNHMKKFGEVENAFFDQKIPFLLVTYRYRPDAEKAVREGCQYKGTTLKMTWHTPSTPAATTTNTTTASIKNSASTTATTTFNASINQYTSSQPSHSSSSSSLSSTHHLTDGSRVELNFSHFAQHDKRTTNDDDAGDGEEEEEEEEDNYDDGAPVNNNNDGDDDTRNDSADDEEEDDDGDEDDGGYGYEQSWNYGENDELDENALLGIDDEEDEDEDDDVGRSWRR